MKNFTYFIKLNNDYGGIFDLLSERLTILENQNKKQEIENLENENNRLQAQKDNLKSEYNGIELNSGEELISIVFTSEDDGFQDCFICKNTDKFKDIEEKFYTERQPHLKDSTNIFKINGKVIDKSKTMKENSIGDSSTIICFAEKN